MGEIFRKIFVKFVKFFKFATVAGKQVLVKIQEYRINWSQHINGMPHNRLLGILNNYRSTGRIDRGRPCKRLMDM
jgi:hypothetical protein